MLSAHHQPVKVKHMDKEGILKFLVSCVKAITPSTVVPSLTKLKEFWMTILLHRYGSLLDIKKLLPSPPLVENPTGPPLWSAETSIIENEPSESIPDKIQKVEAAVDSVLPSEGSSSNDTVTEEKESDTIQILFINTDSDELGGSLLVPLQQEGSSSESYLAVYSVPPPSNLVVSFDWNLLGRPRLPSNAPFRIIVQVCNMVMVGTIIDEGASLSILS